MRDKRRIEAAALDIVETVITTGRVEDDRIECKGEWPTDPRKAARQIGALCNAAGGDDVMWVVGLSEATKSVVDPGDTEPANWWAQVSRCFAELAPEVSVLRVPTQHGQVVVLAFGTDRAPYVVTTTGLGGVDREVPWRTASGTRSAHRSELLRAVIQQAQAPSLELIEARLRLERDVPTDYGATDRHDLYIEFAMAAYLSAPEPVRLPQHLWSAHLRVEDQEVEVPMSVVGPYAPPGWTRSPETRIGSINYVASSGLHVDGSDRVNVRCDAGMSDPGNIRELLANAAAVSVRLRFPVALSQRVSELEVQLERRDLGPQVKQAGRSDHRIGDFTSGEHVVPHSYFGRD